MQIKLIVPNRETETLKFCAGMVINAVTCDYKEKGKRHVILEVEKPPSEEEKIRAQIKKIDGFIDGCRKENDSFGMLEFQYRKAEL